MARKKLSDLVKTESGSYRVTDSQTPKVPDSQQTEAPKLPTPKVTELQSTELPKYLTLIRKEARLREDQLEKLTVLARQLNRQKRGKERITENTLIRLAIDFLLEHAEQLDGGSEDELRDSLSLEVTE